ncbi:MAG: 4Fe-4S binding protein [Desulfobacula sp.]
MFDQEKCSVCELCVVTCPTRAMVLFSAETQDVA